MKKIIYASAILIFIFFNFGCTKKDVKSIQLQNGEGEVKSVEKEFAVGFIYRGKVSDLGWSYEHNEGRRYLEKTLRIKTLYRESVTTTQEIKDVVKAMIEQGAKIIFVTSSGYSKYVTELAIEHPEVIFITYSDSDSEYSNLGNYFVRTDEAGFLCGVAAGLKTKSGKIGYSAAYPISEIIRSINGFALGVKSVNPDAKMYVRFTNSWNSLKEDQKNIELFIKSEIDTVYLYQDNLDIIKRNNNRDIFFSALNTNDSTSNLKSVFPVLHWNWGKWYVDILNDIKSKKWKNKTYSLGIGEGIFEIYPSTKKYSDEEYQKLKDISEKISSGEFKIFKGPIRDQNKILKIESDKIPNDKEINGFNWFVEGIYGKIK